MICTNHRCLLHVASWHHHICCIWLCALATSPWIVNAILVFHTWKLFRFNVNPLEGKLNSNVLLTLDLQLRIVFVRTDNRYFACSFLTNIPWSTIYLVKVLPITSWRAILFRLRNFSFRNRFFSPFWEYYPTEN